MCVDGCMETISKRLKRRDFMKASLAGAAIMASSGLSQTTTAKTIATPQSFKNIVDLTHTLSPEFPTFGGNSQFSMKSIATVKDNGYAVN